MTKLLLRSLMFLPAHNERYLKSAAKSDADVLVLDLEDSVQSKENKQIARDKIKDWVKEGRFKNRTVFVRINERESGELLKDVFQLTISGITGFIYPKAYTSKDIYFIDKLLDTIEFEKGIKKRTFKLIPIIETCKAILNAKKICKASKRNVAVIYGSEDHISDLQGIHDKEHDTLFTPRAIIAMAARACHIAPIDASHVNVHDLDDLVVNLRISNKLGYDGMVVLNPIELELVHQYFTPSKEKVKKAEEMLRLAKVANDAGKGVALIDGIFIGPPMIKAAEKTLHIHKQIEAKKVK